MWLHHTVIAKKLNSYREKCHCERIEAIWFASSVCFVATLLAMTAPRNDNEGIRAMTLDMEN